MISTLELILTPIKHKLKYFENCWKLVLPKRNNKTEYSDNIYCKQFMIFIWYFKMTHSNALRISGFVGSNNYLTSLSYSFFYQVILQVGLLDIKEFSPCLELAIWLEGTKNSSYFEHEL